MDANPVTLEPISPGSVVDVAYRRIRTLIEDGELGPSARLRQGDLADALAISRTSVREALHRLTADELVEFKANRGFFVASFRLDAFLAMYAWHGKHHTAHITRLRERMGWA